MTLRAAPAQIINPERATEAILTPAPVHYHRCAGQAGGGEAGGGEAEAAGTACSVQNMSLGK